MQANESGSTVDLATRGLKLDELEVASLRGEVQEASLQLDLGARLGRGAWSVQVHIFSWGLLGMGRLEQCMGGAGSCAASGPRFTPGQGRLVRSDEHPVGHDSVWPAVHVCCSERLLLL